MDDSSHDLLQRCETALDAGVPWEDLWYLIVEHPWHETMLGNFAYYAVLRSVLPSDWEEDVVSVAQDRLATRLAEDRYLGVAKDAVAKHYLPALRRAARDDCRHAVRDEGRHRQRRAPNVDPDDLSQDEPLADVRMDFESLLPKLTDGQQLAVVLFDEGYEIREIATAMGLEYRPAYNLLKKALRRLGRWM